LFSSRRRHTRFSRDWSSDVCSSDLVGSRRSVTAPLCAECARAVRRRATPKALVIRHGDADVPYFSVPAEQSVWSATGFGALRSEIGRASCRESVLVAGGGAGLRGGE